jgi:DNA repair protein RecO (recombination protein O)
MSQKLHKTKGIVLRTVKYGETSVIVTIYTELFGLQSYLVNGVRTSTKKGTGKGNLFQPPAILDLVVYHNELKNLHRVREYQWSYIYKAVLTDVMKYAVASYMVELLLKCLKQPEPNSDLYNFCEDSFIRLDESSGAVTANYPLFFSLHLPVFFGFRMNDGYSINNKYLDLQEGTFVSDMPGHPHFLDENQAEITSEILKVRQPSELADIKLNQEFRRNLLYAYEVYYALHIQEFGMMKTLPVLREILN